MARQVRTGIVGKAGSKDVNGHNNRAGAPAMVMAASVAHNRASRVLAHTLVHQRPRAKLSARQLRQARSTLLGTFGHDTEQRGYNNNAMR